MKLSNTDTNLTSEQRKVASEALLADLREDQEIANRLNTLALNQNGILNADAGILRTQGFTEAASRANAAAVNANLVAQAAASYKSAVDAAINVTSRWGLANMWNISGLTIELGASKLSTQIKMNFVNTEIGNFNMNCGLFKIAKEKALVSTPGTPVTPVTPGISVTLGGALTAEQIAINKQTAEQERSSLIASHSNAENLRLQMVSDSADLKTHGNLLRAWEFVPAAESHEWAAESANVAAEMAFNLRQTYLMLSMAFLNWGNSTNQEMAASKKAILDNQKASMTATLAAFNKEQQFFSTAMVAANTERGKIVIIMKNQNAQQSMDLRRRTEAANDLKQTIDVETASMRSSGFTEAQAAHEAAEKELLQWLATAEKARNALASELNSLLAYGNSQTVRIVMEQGAKVQEARSALRNELSGLGVLFASLQAKLASALSAKNKALATKAAADAAAAKVLADGNQSNPALQEEARAAAERARVASEAAAASAEAARVAAKTASEAAAAEAARVAAKTASDALAEKEKADAKAVPAENEAAKKKAQELKDDIHSYKIMFWVLLACGILISSFGVGIVLKTDHKSGGGIMIFFGIFLIVFSAVYLANGGGIQTKLFV